MWPRLPLIVLAISFSPVSLLAQAHGYTDADVEEGGRIFRNNCVICHGPDGNFIPGINLGRGQYKTAVSDADLIKVIRNGVPNTPMPPSNYNELQATWIVAYLRSMATDTQRASAQGGDPVAGKAWYDKSDCASCHRIKGVGSRSGPDLTEIGSVRRVAELEKSLFEPDAEILPQNRTFQAVTSAGATVTGTLLNHDVFSVQLLDAKDQLLSLPKAQLKQQGFLPKSPMPSYKDKLNSQELAHLLAYLSSLKGAN
jgi:putative heme-binding domain-containing protein